MYLVYSNILSISNIQTLYYHTGYGGDYTTLTRARTHMVIFDFLDTKEDVEKTRQRVIPRNPSEFNSFCYIYELNAGIVEKSSRFN